tara:strand:+ start:1096 stop:1575 length:480 start_codon:yes stop_codon:yes gene_type:complete
MEKIYFECNKKSKKIKITNKRAVLGSRTFVLNNISSVDLKMKEQRPQVKHGKDMKLSGKGCFICLVLLLCWTILAIIILGNKDGMLNGMLSIAFILLLGIFVSRKFISWGEKEIEEHDVVEYFVRIGTNSGENDILISENFEYCQEIVDAMNNAIIENH